MVEEIKRPVARQDLFLLWKNLLVEQDILHGILEIIKFKILTKIVLHVTLESFHTPCVPVFTLKVHVTVTQRKEIGRRTRIIP